MVNILKSFLYSSSLALLMITSTAMAQIPPNAFREITRHFKDGKQAYSPVLGGIALQIGLIENLRFLGPFEAAYNPNESRDYKKDHSSDPLWNIVNILFPSNSGNLSVESQANTGE